MLKIGAHLSASKGYMAMLNEMAQMGANTFQFFTRNPRGGKAKELNMDDIHSFIKTMPLHGVESVLAHASYTINPCSKDSTIRQFALNTIIDDLNRLSHTPNQFYNIHPGSHVGQGTQIGIQYIADTLNQVLKPDMTTHFLLETMSGKGSEIGSSFHELKEIINRCELGHLIGVCLDTCHVYSAGYDIVNNLDGVLEEFDTILGLNRLKMIHLNDNLLPFNCKNDRHARIGEGTIGADALVRLINHPRLKNLSFILETPNEFDGYKKEIAFFKANSN